MTDEQFISRDKFNEIKQAIATKAEFFYQPKKREDNNQIWLTIYCGKGTDKVCRTMLMYDGWVRGDRFGGNTSWLEHTYDEYVERFNTMLSNLNLYAQKGEQLAMWGM